MQVCRIVANIEGSDPKAARNFYQTFFGLDVLMDHGWIQTFGSEQETTIQLSVVSEGGSGTAVPDLTIEVDDLSAALAKVKEARVPVAYGPASEPWGVRRFYIRDPFVSSSTFCSMNEKWYEISFRPLAAVGRLTGLLSAASPAPAITQRRF